MIQLSRSPIARKRDPITSKLSARELSKTGARARQQHAVLVALKRYSNCTSAELARKFGMNRYATARRLPELLSAKLAMRSIKRNRFCSITGRLCFTWSAK